MSISASSGSAAPRSNISGYKLRQTPNFTPEMMQLFQKLLGGASGGIGKGLDYLSGIAGGGEEGFEEAEAPYYAAFEKALGQLGTRFGGLGAQGSSAFQNATSGAASDLAQQIGGNRMNLRQNAIKELLGLSENLLGQKPYENFLEKKGGGIGDILGSLLGEGAGAFGGGFGGGIASKLLQKLFGGR